MSAEGTNLQPARFEADLAKAHKDFDVVQSDDLTLLVDLDTPEARAQFKRVLPKVRAEFGVEQIQTWLSKSGNVHATVTLSAPLPVAERLALQAALGSDGVREALAVKRLRNGCVEPSVLFKPRESTTRIWVGDADAVMGDFLG